MGLFLEEKIGNDDIEVVLKEIVEILEDRGVLGFNLNEDTFGLLREIDKYGWVSYDCEDTNEKWERKKMRLREFREVLESENMELIKEILDNKGLWEIKLFD